MTDPIKQAIEALEKAEKYVGKHQLDTMLTGIETALHALRSAASERVGEWQRVAHVFGERLGRTGPDGYYAMTPDQWLEWATNELEHLMYQGNRKPAPQPQTVSREAIERAMDCIYLEGDVMGASIQGEEQAVKNLLALQLPAPQSAAASVPSVTEMKHAYQAGFDREWESECWTGDDEDDDDMDRRDASVEAGWESIHALLVEKLGER